MNMTLFWQYNLFKIKIKQISKGGFCIIEKKDWRLAVYMTYHFCYSRRAVGNLKTKWLKAESESQRNSIAISDSKA